MCGRTGRVPVAALRAMVADGQIAPTVRVYQSELNRMQTTADPMTRLRMIEDMLEREPIPARYHNEQVAHLQGMREDACREAMPAAERDAMPAMDAAPMSPPLMPVLVQGEDGGNSAREREKNKNGIRTMCLY